MDREGLILESENLKKELEALVDSINKDIDKLPNVLKVFCCLLFSNSSEISSDNASDLLTSLGNLVYELSNKIKEYEDLNQKYVENATALTASEDIPVPVISIENENILASLIYLYKIIKALINQQFINPNYAIHLMSEEQTKMYIENLTPLYVALKYRLPKEKLDKFLIKYIESKQFDKTSILELFPSETDFQYAKEEGKLYQIPVAANSNPSTDEDFSDSDFDSEELEEEADTSMGDDEDFSDDDFSDDDFSDDDLSETESSNPDLGAKEDDDFSDDDFSDEDSSSDLNPQEEEVTSTENPTPTEIGGTILMSSEDLEDLEEPDNYIYIRPKEKDETIDQYEAYIRDLYMAYGFEPKYEDCSEKIFSLLEPYDLEKIDLSELKKVRDLYPHEKDHPVKEVKWGKYTIVSTIEGEDIYSDYYEYMESIKENIQQVIKRNIKEMKLPNIISFLRKKNNKNGYYLYTSQINKLIDLLEKSASRTSNPDTYYLVALDFAFKTNNDETEATHYFNVQANLSKEEVEEIIKIVKALNMNNIEFIKNIKFDILFMFKDDIPKEYSYIEYLEDKLNEEKREEEVIDMTNPDEAEEETEKKDATQSASAEENQTEQVATVIEDEEEEKIDNSPDSTTQVLIDTIKEKDDTISTLREELFKIKEQLRAAQEEASKKGKASKQPEENITEESSETTRTIQPKRTATNAIPKEMKTLIHYKVEVYQIIISKLFAKGLEISPENFNNILKDLYENQDSTKEYKIEFDGENYIITNEIYGEKQSSTISYKGFVRMAESSFEQEKNSQEYSIVNGSYRVVLNLNKMAPEKVDTTKAIIYSCISDSKINVRGKKIIISTFILNQLAKKQAKANVSYTSEKDSGIRPGYELNFAELKSKDEDMEIPLTNGDLYKPITISLFLKNGEEISIILERETKEKRKVM